MRRAALLLTALCLLATDALGRQALQAQPSRPQAGVGAAWSSARVLGPPNAKAGMDDPNAWASLAADAGPEWLEVRFDRPVKLRELRVHQNFNPGAVAKIEALTSDGAVVVWEGTDTARKPVLGVQPTGTVRAKRFKIHLDTRRVPGWNEVDAVALVGDDMTLQWAESAKASSSYANIGAGPLVGLVGKRVRVVHSKGSVVGPLIADHGALLELRRADGRPVFVGKAQVVTLEAE